MTGQEFVGVVGEPLVDRLLASPVLTGRWSPGGLTVAAGEALAGLLDRVVNRRYAGNELIPDEDLDAETLQLLNEIRARHARGEMA
jgi:hypothetical protein